MASAGLLDRKKNSPVPLRSVRVEGTVRGYTAGTTSTLEYENEEEEPIEAIFTFPLDASSTVVDFSATVQSRKIVGRVEEKQKARETYDDAIASGQSAFLMESEREDVFTVAVGNLPPMEKASVTVGFVMELPTEPDGSLRFNLPSVLTPRYSPSSELQPEEPSNPTAHVTYLPSHQIPYTFSFNMRIEADVAKVESTTHKLAVSQSNDEGRFSLTTVTLAEDEEHQFDKDLVLTISPSHPHQPCAVVEQGSIKDSDPPLLTNPVVALNFFPDFSSATAISELIFVIDRSASMEGEYTEAVKATLMLFLKSIPDGCYFNVVGFGSSYKFLFETSSPYDQAHLDQASEYTRTIQADMVGTELLQPLQEIFKMVSIKGLPKQVFVLTDGAVSDTTRVIKEVKKNSHKARCFAVGIGSGASTALVKGIADAGRGSSELVQKGEKMQAKVMRMLKRALTPSLCDVHVNWSLPAGVEVIQTPSEVPPVFSGDRLVIYGFISKTFLQTECHATLQGVCGGSPFECSVSSSIIPLSQAMNKTIHQVATKCMIHDLQEEEIAPKSQEMLKELVVKEAREAPAREAPREAPQSKLESIFKGLKRLVTKGARKAPQSNRELIVELSIAANVVCQKTAFVAVDKDSLQPVQGSMQLRQVPVATSYGRRRKVQGKKFLRWNIDLRIAKPRFMQRHSDVHMCCDMASEPERAFACDEDFEFNRACQVSDRRSPTPPDTFSVIVSQQKASGAWEMNSIIASLLNQSVSDAGLRSPMGQQLSEIQPSIWATCIVIAWLEAQCADLEDEWELLADKAKSWLQKQSMPGTLTCNDVLAAARKLF